MSVDRTESKKTLADVMHELDLAESRQEYAEAARLRELALKWNDNEGKVEHQ
jgi:hypothetical protein